MLDDTLKAQLQAYLQRVTQPFELVASLANAAAPTETDLQVKELLADIVDASGGKISARFDGTNARKPSFNLVRPQGGAELNLTFAGLPLGHEFTSLVLALLWTGGHPPKVEADVIEQIKGLDGDFNF